MAANDLTKDSLDLAETPASDLKPIDYARRTWIPRRFGNRAVSPPTMYRWAKKGVYGEKLAILMMPGGAVTSEAACKDFLRRVHVARMARGADGSNEALVDATDDELQKAGLA